MAWRNAEEDLANLSVLKLGGIVADKALSLTMKILEDDREMFSVFYQRLRAAASAGLPLLWREEPRTD